MKNQMYFLMYRDFWNIFLNQLIEMKRGENLIIENWDVISIKTKTK